MKIWHATSADHSAALTIVGTFHREEDAQAAEILVKAIMEAASAAACEVSRLEDLEYEAESGLEKARELAAKLCTRDPGKIPEDFAEKFATKFAEKAPSKKAVLRPRWFRRKNGRKPSSRTKSVITSASGISTT